MSRRLEIYEYSARDIDTNEVICTGTRRDLSDFFNVDNFDAWKYAEKGTLYGGRYQITKTECIRKCAWCGAEFRPRTSRSITCSESCNTKHRKEYNLKLQRERKGYYRRRMGKQLSLAETNEKARKKGMTYGQYKAQEQLKNFWEGGKAKEKAFPETKNNTIDLMSISIWKGVKNA